MHCQLQLRKKINNQITYSDGIFNLVKESLFFHTIDMFRLVLQGHRTHLRATSGYTNIFMFFSILCLRRIDRDYISTINEMPVTRNVRN